MRSVCRASRRALVVVLLVSIAGCGTQSEAPSESPHSSPSGPETATVELMAVSRATGAPVPASEVEVNGARVGTTAADGSLTFERSPGPTSIVIRSPGYLPASGGALLEPGAAVSLTFPMIHESDLREIEIDVSEAQGGFVAPDSQTFTLRAQLRESGDDVPITQIEALHFRTPEDGLDATNLFSPTATGELVSRDPAVLLDLARGTEGSVTISGRIVDERNTVHEVTTRFRLGKVTLRGRLEAPPSRPGLPISGITVSALDLHTADSFETVSDEAGLFAFPALPAGVFEVRVDVDAEGELFHAAAPVSLDRDRIVVLRPLSTIDLLSGISAMRFSDLWPPPFPPDPAVEPATSTAAPSEASGSANASVVSGPVDDPQTAMDDLIVGPGDPKVYLRYTVCTDEVSFEDGQTPFDDIWQLEIITGSSVLYSEMVTVGSQLAGAPPLVGEEGCTPPIALAFGIQDPTTLLLVVRSTNVGDSFVETRVDAELSATPLTVSLASLHYGKVKKRDGRNHRALHDVISIPRIGEDANVDPKHFYIELNRGPNVTIDGVIVDLLLIDEFGLVIQTYRILGSPFDVPHPLDPSGEDRLPIDLVQIVTANPENFAPSDRSDKISSNATPTCQRYSDTPYSAGFVDTHPPSPEGREYLKVDVSYRTVASNVPSAGAPLSSRVRYRFRVYFSDPESTAPIIGEITSDDMVGLWRIPDTVVRAVRVEDTGGDGWGSKDTYEWLDDVEHQRLLSGHDADSGADVTDQGAHLARTGTNDVSGEHGINLAHAGHVYGCDMDMRHYRMFPQSQSGRQQKDNLRTWVMDVITASEFGAPVGGEIDIPGDLTGEPLNRLTQLDLFHDAERERLQSLGEDETTSAIVIGLGARSPRNWTNPTVLATGSFGLARNWRHQLMAEGKVTLEDGANQSFRVVDFGFGDWTWLEENANCVERAEQADIACTLDSGEFANDTLLVQFRTDHDDHNHVSWDFTR